MSEQTPDTPPKQEKKRRKETPADQVSIRAQQLAAEHGIDVSNVQGTGHEGRVRYADVQKHVK